MVAQFNGITVLPTQLSDAGQVEESSICSQMVPVGDENGGVPDEPRAGGDGANGSENHQLEVTTYQIRRHVLHYILLVIYLFLSKLGLHWTYDDSTYS